MVKLVVQAYVGIACGKEHNMIRYNAVRLQNP